MLATPMSGEPITDKMIALAAEINAEHEAADRAARVAWLKEKPAPDND